jgi:hypothetical protein
MNEQIIQTLLREALPQLLVNVPPEDVIVVAARFEHLLRLVLDVDHLPFSLPEAATWDVGRDLIKETSEVSPEKRLEYIQLKLLDKEVSDLEERAQDLAEKSLNASADLPALQAEAKPIQKQIEELYREFKKSGMDWERRYGLALSEADLDCGFVLGEHHFSSMRLGRRIEALKKLGIWPPAWYAELWSGKNVKDK